MKKNVFGQVQSFGITKMKLDFQIIDWKFRILRHTLDQLPAQVKTGIKRGQTVAHYCTHLC